jgi:hypothetical protein
MKRPAPHPPIQLCQSRPAPSVQFWQRGHDHRDTLSVPALHGFMIRAQSDAQSSPGVQVSVRDRMDQTPRANHTPKHVTVQWDQQDPCHRLIHAVDFLRRRGRGPDPRGFPTVRLQCGPNDFERRAAQPRRPTGTWQREQGGAGFLQSVNHVIRIHRTIVGYPASRRAALTRRWAASCGRRHDRTQREPIGRLIGSALESGKGRLPITFLG